jgi:phenylacetate-CoA ligase
VSYAYCYVPFYHEKYKKAGVKPSDVKTLEDLSKLPVVRKNELRAEQPRRLVSVEFDPQRLKVVRTSGSTGEPFRVYLAPSEDDWRKAIYMRANISCGQKPRDCWVAITAPHHFGDTTNLQQRLGIFARRNISVFSDIDSQIQFVNEARPDVLDGYSGSLLLFAKEYTKRGVSPSNPRIIFGTAELIDETSVKIIERVFNAPYYDQFGCVELDRTAWQCPEKIGYHMDVDSVITQFVDSDGNEVSVGEAGDVSYTSLFNYAMPLLRYAVGDVGKSTPEECPCGRKFPLMKVVEGRKDSFIKLPNGHWISPRAFTVAMSMFSRYQEISAFRIIQKKPDYIEFYIKSEEEDRKKKQTMEKELQDHIRATLALDEFGVSISIMCVDSIPPTKTGKLTAVSSEVNT